MIVLNGATGLSEALASALSQGAAGLSLARNLLGTLGAKPRPDAGADGRHRRRPRTNMRS